MAEMTDAELVEAAARAMGFRYWEVPVVVDYGTGETQNQPCYETPNGPLDPRHWNPLAVNADGEPTESAKAQLWDIETWLASLSGMELGIWRGQPSSDWCVRVKDWVTGATEIVRCAPTRPRALLLAAVAVGKERT